MKPLEYRIVYSDEARDFFASRRVDNRVKRMILDKIHLLSRDPTLGKPLGGELQGCRRLAVSYYRVIYHVLRAELVVDIVRIGLRRDIYGD